MSQIISLPQFKDEAEKYAKDNLDKLANSSSFTFTARGVVNFAADSDIPMFAGMKTEEKGTLDPWSLYQLNSRFGGPPISWVRDQKRNPDDLWMTMFNWFANHRPDARLLMRLRDEGSRTRVRAVMSDEYVPFDGNQVIPLVENGIEAMKQELGMPDLKVVVARPIVGDTTSGYILFPDVSFGEDPRGRGGRGDGKLHPGFFFSANDVGNGGIRTAGGLFTTYCYNGMIYGWHQKDAETNPASFIRHRWIDADLIQRKLTHSIAWAFNLSEPIAKAYIQSYDVSLPKEAKAMAAKFAEWRSTYKMTEEATDVWMNATVVEASMRGSSNITLGDAINGLTLQAHATEDALEKQGLEVIAGTLLGSFFKDILGAKTAREEAYAIAGDNAWVQSEF